jgi:predicted metalloprotease with PDZ domain
LAAVLAAVPLKLPAQTPSPAAPRSTPAPLQLTYHLRISEPASHLAEVEIDAAGVSAPTIRFDMPAWSPGRYAIYNFGKNVQDFSAKTPDGRALPWSQPDKQTWSVETGGSAEVRVRYEVYGNDLNGSFSQIDTTHANLNGASIFMYLSGHKPDPIHLNVEAPSGWQILSGYSLDTSQRDFEAPNYDRLIDTPLEISPTVAIDTFTDHGKTFRVGVHDYDADDEQRGALVKQLVEGVKKIVSIEMAMMPEPDFDHYTFLFHFAPDISAGDGMEHLNSTQIIINQPLSTGIDDALVDVAHEFFHLWNVKRLRPEALGPFDYTKEGYTRSLWFAEGVTTYYSYVTLMRAGIWTQDDFLERLSDEIEQLRSDPGRELMSAESSSFHAWFYDRAPQMQETNFANTTISYYNKGTLLGMLLDLEIRARMKGRKSLDDVMRLMYQRFYGAPANSYYLPGRGYHESDILQAVNEVSGSNFGDFFDHYVKGTLPLPFDEILGKAGLALKVKVPLGAAPWLGVVTRPVTNGVQIIDVLPGSPAERAGLSRDDILISADNFSLATASLQDRLRIYAPGAEVAFTVQRHLQRDIVTVKLDPPRADAYTIEGLPHATADEVALKQGWLVAPQGAR